MKGYQRSLLIDESPLQVIPKLAVAIGLNEAIMLQQIHYWQRISQNEKDGMRYVAMSAPELADKFSFWSEPTIKRTIASLRLKGLLTVTKRSDSSWERANWYAVDYEALNHLNLSIGSNCADASYQNDPMHRINLTRSIGSNCADRSDQNDPMSVYGKNKEQEKVVGDAASPGLRKQKKGKTLIPSDFGISDQVRAWAKQHGFEPYLEAHLSYLKDYAASNAVLKADWDATLRNAIRADWGGVRKAILQLEGGKPQAAQRAWWQTAPGIESKGRELRIEREPDEPFPYFKNRVFKAAGSGPWMGQ